MEPMKPDAWFGSDKDWASFLRKWRQRRRSAILQKTTNRKARKANPRAVIPTRSLYLKKFG